MHRAVLRLVRAVLALAVLPGLAACVAPCDYGQGDVVPVATQSRLPIVPVEVDGRRVPFLLDTGASHTVLLPEGVAALGLRADGMRSSRTTGTAGESRERNVLVGRMRVGRREMRGLTLPVAAHSMPGQRLMAGVLGADFLRISELDIDLPARRATLHARRACHLAALPWPGAYDALPVLVESNGLVTLPVEVNGRPVRALFDTGATSTVLRRSLAPEIGVPEEAAARLPTRIAHGVGPTGREVRVLPGATVRVGEEVLEGMPLGLSELPDPAPFDMILGQDYIGVRRVWLSYAEGRLFVQRPGAAATAAPAAPPAPAPR